MGRCRAIVNYFIEIRYNMKMDIWIAILKINTVVGDAKGCKQYEDGKWMAFVEGNTTSKFLRIRK